MAAWSSAFDVEAHAVVGFYYRRHLVRAWLRVRGIIGGRVRVRGPGEAQAGGGDRDRGLRSATVSVLVEVGVLMPMGVRIW